jgi:hypothetical protein
MGHIRLLLTCVACVAACACKRSAPAPAPAQAAAAKPASIVRIEDACPVQVPATAVTVVNTKTGVAMFFTTMPANVNEVRRRVSLLAKMDNPPAAPPSADMPEVDPPPSVFGAPAKLVPLQAKVEEISDGASLVLTPLNPMDVESLRAYVRNSAQHMHLGRCPADFLQKHRVSGPQDAGAPPADRLG